MKKCFLLFILVCCVAFTGCGTKTINGVKIDDAQCKTLLDWVIAKNSYKTDLYDTKDYDFDVFYSKKYNTCISTFTHFSKKEWVNETLQYYIIDELDNKNLCLFMWVDWYQDWLVECAWKFEKIIKDGYKMSFDSEREVTNLYNGVLDSLK